MGKSWTSRWACLALLLLASSGCATIQPPPSSAPVTTTPAPSQPPSPSRAEALELTFVGDIVLGTYSTRGPGITFVELHPPDADPFAEVRELLAADVVVGNLESPLARTLPELPAIGTRYRYGAGAAHVGLLQRAGFSVLSLANNHYFDLGVIGQLDGPALLREAGLVPIGVAQHEAPWLRVETLEVQGWRLGFVACTTVRNHPGERDGPRVPTLSFARTEELLDVVSAARVEHDLVIVSVHWGSEYADEVGDAQRYLARRLATAGVDLLVGHHPHVLQAVDLLERDDGRDTLVAFSLGNFLFPRLSAPARFSAILRVEYRDVPDARPCLAAARLHPVQIQREPAWHPEPARGHVASQVRQRIVDVSRAHGTRFARGEQEDLLIAGLQACN